MTGRQVDTQLVGRRAAERGEVAKIA